MAWTPFSAEAVRLLSHVEKLNKQGRISDALEAIKDALVKAQRDGPADISYAQFEADAERDAAAAEPAGSRQERT